METRSDYDEALHLIEELHPSVDVLSSAARKVRDSNVEVGDLEKILRTDPSISVDVIRLSNSAYYSYAEPSRDLNTSISRIGFDELIKLIGFSLSRNLFAQDLIHYDQAAIDYWSECVSTGILIEAIARLMKINHQEAYTVGLLSSTGKMVVDQVLETFGRNEIYTGSGEDLLAWEKELLGFDHAFAGAMILKRWAFPEEITVAIQHQYKVDAAKEPNPILHALAFTRQMMAQTGYGLANENIEMDERMERFLSDYHIEEQAMFQALIDCAEKFNIIKRELEIGSVV